MSNADCDDRLIRILLRHERLGDAPTFRLTPDGRIVAEPGPRDRWALLKVLSLILAMALGAKVVALATLGEDVYATRLALLQAGSAPERAAGWLLRPDPVTGALVAGLDGLAP